MIDTVLFDLDGTLVDSIAGLVASFAHVQAANPGMKRIHRSEVLQQVGRPFYELFAAMAGEGQGAEGLLEEFRRHNRATIGSLRLFPGCLNVLETLRAKGIKTGIVTSKGRASTMLVVAALELADKFGVILAKEDCTDHKPSPKPILQAVAALGSKPDATLYLGDSVYDIQAAHAAGCTSAAALWGAQDRAALTAETPRFALASPFDLLPCLGLAASPSG